MKEKSTVHVQLIQSEEENKTFLIPRYVTISFDQGRTQGFHQGGGTDGYKVNFSPN